MAPKGNAKAVAAREAKAGRENEKKSKESAAKEAEEEAEWGKGAKKAKPDDKAAKAEAARAAKAARDAALAEEEAALASSKSKPAPKAGAKKPAKIATPAAKSSPGSSVPGTPKAGGASGGIPSFEDAMNADPESFSASNLDDALSLLSLVNEKQDKASLGSKAAQTLDAHPERRYKAAFAAYKERELPVLRKEHPGLRLQQYEELMFKNFKKSPENPFNQATVAFDATKEEKLEALKKLRAETENRLREKTA